MFIVIGLMLLGIGVGYAFRSVKIEWVHKLITVFIWTLLFILGIEVGGNRQIIEGLATLGVEALLIASFSTMGSVVFAWLLWKRLKRRR